MSDIDGVSLWKINFSQKISHLQILLTVDSLASFNIIGKSSSGYGYTNLLYVTFLLGLGFGEDENVETGIWSYQQKAKNM